MNTISSEELLNYLTRKIDSGYPNWISFKKSNNFSDLELLVQNIIIEGDLILKSVNVYPIITFKETTFTGRIYFDRIKRKIENLSFITCCFKEIISFSDLQILTLKFNNSTFENIIHIQNGNFDDCVIETKKAGGIKISGGYFNRFDLRGTEIQRIFIKGWDIFFENLDINVTNSNLEFGINTIISNLSIGGRLSEHNYFLISDIIVHTLKFHYLKNKGVCEFSNISVSDKTFKKSPLKIEQFYKNLDIPERKKELILKKIKRNYNLTDPLQNLRLDLTDEYYQLKRLHNLDILNKEAYSSLSFNRCVLGNFKIANIDLDRFNSIDIKDTDFSTIDIFNATFPTNKFSGSPSEIYENINRLSIIAKEKLNKRDEIKYYVESRKQLIEYLKVKRVEYKLKNKPFYFKNSFFNYEKKIGSFFYLRGSLFTLQASNFFSEFGTNWFRAVKVTAVFALIPFVVMLLIGYYPEFSQTGFKNFLNIIGDYFKFLNPTHSIDFMYVNKSSFSDNTLYIIADFFGRIVVGFGIFEVIQSFRKYVKK